jgi:hypothetical protein
LDVKKEMHGRLSEGIEELKKLGKEKESNGM